MPLLASRLCFSPAECQLYQKQGSISDLKECFSSHRLCNELENILGKMGMPSDMEELMELKVKTELVSRLGLLCLT